MNMESILHVVQGVIQANCAPLYRRSCCHGKQGIILVHVFYFNTILMLY